MRNAADSLKTFGYFVLGAAMIGTPIVILNAYREAIFNLLLG
jgi:hypothetical protein